MLTTLRDPPPGRSKEQRKLKSDHRQTGGKIKRG